MDFKRLFGWLVIGAFLTLPLISPFIVGAAGERQWEQQAEETFFLGRGMGRQLMTQEEWQQHRQKMRTLTPAEREE